MSGPSFEQLVASACAGVVRDEVERALAEQREILAPLRTYGEILRRRGALSVRETAEVLGVHEDTVRKWIAARELVPLDLSGGRVLIGTDQILNKLSAADARRRNCGEAPK